MLASMTLSQCFVLLLLAVPVVSAANITECDYFNASSCTEEDTNFALKNYGICRFDACGGDDVVVSTRNRSSIQGASCVGDSYLRLIDIADGDLLGYSDNVDDDECSEIIFSLPEGYACHTYETRVGCLGQERDCEARVVVNVSDTRPRFVHDTINNVSSPSGISWKLNCSEFNVSGSGGVGDSATVLDYEANKTSVCSFEACAGEYYEITMDGCVNGATGQVLSYGGAERSDDVITSLECGNTTFIDGFGSSGGSSCQLVSVYQTCLENSEVYCSAQTTIAAKKYPPVDLQWVDAIFAAPGRPLRYLVSNFTVNDVTAQPYLDANSSDLYIAVYKTDMLANQDKCGYVAFDGSTDVNFFDYMDVAAWDGVAHQAYVTLSPSSENYLVTEFGGQFSLVVWLWRKSMSSPIMVASTGAGEMFIRGTASVTITITQGGTGEAVEGDYKFSGAQSKDGDTLVVYALDEEGSCHHHHPKEDYSATLWHHALTPSEQNSSSGSFSTAVADQGSPFHLPSGSEGMCGSGSSGGRGYEVRYMRAGEVLARSDVLPRDDPSSVPTSVPTSAESEQGSGRAADYTLEYSLLIAAIVIAVGGVLVYVVCFQTSREGGEVGGARKRSRSRSRRGFDAVSERDDAEGGVYGGDVDVDKVDSSLFEIEMTGEGEDDEEEVVF